MFSFNTTINAAHALQFKSFKLSDLAVQSGCRHPHGAVGWKAWSDIKNGAMAELKAGKKHDYNTPGLTPNLPEWADDVVSKKNAIGVILETAHPAKFGQIVEKAIGSKPLIPERLEKVMRLEDKAIPMENDYSLFKSWLLENLK